jgi:hypothetical protein
MVPCWSIRGKGLSWLRREGPASPPAAAACLLPGGAAVMMRFWRFYPRRAPTWPTPLAGIFFLEQSSEDECIPLKGVPAAAAATRSADEIMRFKLLGNSDTWEVRELRRHIFTNACDIIKQVPAFRLRVRLSGRFWEKIEAALGWR